MTRFAAAAGRIVDNPFAAMDERIAAARAAGRDVADLTKGNPDLAPPAALRQRAADAALDPANGGYPPFDGKPAMLEAAAGWYGREQGVALDPATEIFSVEGAVDGLATLFSVLAGPGDTVAFADPYYPSYHSMAALAGAEERRLPARAELGFLPDLAAVPPAQWERTAMLVLNYPNNPTGAQAPASFFEEAVGLARRHGFAIVHDFAYAGFAAEGFREQASFLSVPGAKDVGVEILSMSKMFSVAGWRAGFVAGNAGIVSVVKRHHYQMGSMVASPVQDAVTAALDGAAADDVSRFAETYRARRRRVAGMLSFAGLDVFDSPGGVYVWARVPERFGGSAACGATGFAGSAGKTGGVGDADAFAAWLLDAADVAVLPGSCFGDTARDCVRISLLAPDATIDEGARRIVSALYRGSSC